MTTTVTPPPLPPTNPVAPEPPRPPSSAPRVIAILTIALGCVVVVGTVFSAVASTVASALVRTETRSTSVTGVSDLDVDLSAGTLTVVFTDEVSDAQLDVTGTAGAADWTFRDDEGTLVVASPDRRWFAPNWWWGGPSRAVLRLPADLESARLDADFDVSAGDLTVTGPFRELDITVGAGRVSVDGSADDVSVDLSAGGADLDLTAVDSAELAVSAGSLTARFTGAPPRTISADVSAGSLDLTVPDGEYDVRSDVTAGDFDNRIGSVPGASSSITVEVSAGHVTLRAR